MMLLEEESLRDNMMSSACMEVVEQIRKVNKSSFILVCVNLYVL